MAPLATAGYRVVSVDMPGWGRSEPIQPGPLTSDRAVFAALEILDGLEAKLAVLMGKSWGGGVAISLALSNPERVDRLVLTAPAFRELDRLAALACPVLLAWAKDDPVIPYDYAKRFVKAIPDVQLVSYATGGHSAAPQNADDFGLRTLHFLASET
jgi:pimeloyl-ACP methyl ester carboxylesterase